MLTKETKAEIVKKFGQNETDTGSTKVQIALLTARIIYLTEHFKEHTHDHHSRRGLLKLVGSRRHLLNYLKKNDINEYRELIKELGIRK
ncbi:MAG: 30S ribosomal protein S15 [bacterium]|nr:30S ribosomal protein S15 [bacterium]